MEIEIIYPSPKKIDRRKAEGILKGIFLSAAYVCGLINIFVGGKPWSVVVIWILWFIWSLVISRDLVEYNRISQTAKLLVYTCILLILIDLCLSSGWAAFVVPIVSFGALMLIGFMVFTNLSRHKQNLMPMFWLIAAALIAVSVSLSGWPAMNWPILVLGITAVTILGLSVVVLKTDLIRELKKRFHTG